MSAGIEPGRSERGVDNYGVLQRAKAFAIERDAAYFAVQLNIHSFP